MRLRGAKATDPDREAHLIDVQVGQRIRQRRILVCKSQEQLGARLGVSFQQIQKYENGKNRISAGRLVQIADFLGVHVDTFLERFSLQSLPITDTIEGDQHRALKFAAGREGVRLNIAYLNARDPRLRKIAMDLLMLANEPANYEGATGGR